MKHRVQEQTNYKVAVLLRDKGNLVNVELVCSEWNSVAVNQNPKNSVIFSFD